MVWGGVFTTLVFVVALSFASCANSADSGGNPQSNQSSINYSLGDPPKSKPLSEKQFQIKNDSKGIYLTFDIPEKTWQTRVYIEGLGTVAEEVWYNDDRTKGDFFYPFVEAGKTYTIRFVFLREEDYKDGFSLGHVGDGIIGWFQTDVTAGADSKGEVRFTSKGTISVDKKYNFRFTQKPTFQNEIRLTEDGSDWIEEIGLVEGVSWDHGTERRTKWHGSAEIPSTKLTEMCNLFEMCPWVPGIDFVCVRPVKYYEHKGKRYRYQWDSFVQDIYYPMKADRLITIDINDPSQVGQIQGTWKFSDSWDSDLNVNNKIISVKVDITTILIIQGQNLEENDSVAFTKKDGMFTKEEQEYFCVDISSDNSATISSDQKTITQKHNSKSLLSEYFEDVAETDYTQHKELKLFQDSEGNELRIISSGKENGNSYEWYRDYKKQ